MKHKALQMEKGLRTALLILLLGAFGAGNVFADGYDFAEVCPSGQTLYYKIIEDDPNSVMVVPAYYYKDVYPPVFMFWPEGCEKPVGDVIIPETLSNGKVVKEIGKIHNISSPYNSYHYDWLGAFGECTGVTSVTIGNSVTTIDDYAFTGCTNLTSVIIGNSVTSIGTNHDGQHRGAFIDCTSLTNIEFGNSVAFIGSYAFNGCTSLTTLILPNSLTTIEHSAFSDCTNLSSITLPNSVDIVGYHPFHNTAWYNAQSEGVVYLDTWCLGYKGAKPTGSLVIREGTRGVAWSAFSDCSEITSVVFPNSLVSIMDYAFHDTGLTSLTIPKSVAIIRNAFVCSDLTTVYYNAENAKGFSFFYCPNLTTLIIGPDVNRIDANAFSGCNSAHLVVALGETPAVLGAGAFSSLADNTMLMVPCGKKMTYFSQWNMFPYDNILENCEQFLVSMGNIGAGGSVTASTTSAQMGEEVQLTITPNAGMALETISISNVNDPTQTIPYYFIHKANNKIGFIMPQFGVTVHAVFKTSGTSVGENNNIVVSVYPNPTNGQVKIEAEALKHITISNTLGQIIFEGKTSGNTFEYDFRKHGTGLYLIRIETANGIVVKKVSVTL